jgi:hypothetical protein
MVLLSKSIFRIATIACLIPAALTGCKVSGRSSLQRGSAGHRPNDSPRHGVTLTFAGMAGEPEVGLGALGVPAS